MEFEVIVSKNFKKKYNKLSNHLKDRVRKILLKLGTRLMGEALKGDLLNFYSVHFENNRYRLIYYKEDNKIQILAVHLGRRKDNFYNELKKELKRNGIK